MTARRAAAKENDVAPRRRGTRGPGDHGTRGRLLGAASSVFTEKGYRDATIAEISRLAGANIAAVNYHFGGKANLYTAVWHHLFAESTQRHPPDGGVGDDAPPEARLRGRIGALVHRITDNESGIAAIMDKELASPTGLLKEAVQSAIGPMREKMEAILRELLGRCATEADVELCVMSIINQVMALRHRMRGNRPEFRKWLTPKGTEMLADHITRFSLGGIREVRSQRKGNS